MQQAVQIKLLDSRLGKQFPLPNYATAGSAGLDLRAMLKEPLTLMPDETALIASGIAIYLAEPQLAALILPRSGLGHKHGIILGNGVGLIDADYQGEIRVSCWNRAKKPYTIAVGERIAQLLVINRYALLFKQVDEFEQTERGSGGFGHSGQL